MNFRTLEASEIECRVSQISEKGCFLLLYKDARADMALLDEAVGAENWQRTHELVNGNLFCNVGIKTADGWVWKQDVGTESNTEKEKGQASDSFKRACVNWGIGRELYTAPKIWVNASDYKATEKNGKCTTYDTFIVSDISYDDKRNIIGLSITNLRTDKEVFRYGARQAKNTQPSNPAPAQPKADTAPQTAPQGDVISEAKLRTQILKYINRHNMSKESVDKICGYYHVPSIHNMTAAMCRHYIGELNKKGKSIDE